ncbi:DUF503 domain-containing protein [Lederbergia ruris]|uniref:DUF503 domain-containing protein n=1 Tax=Lederbergia ruris TaxID=217495 RepID=A0ABQ4KIS1_9BACI|nr:DUF503 domain-containing protein [Lederbergia ruris]GIN57787.1 hypothetical protein J8TS2_21060 [Lederbergia ruris]
MIGFVELEFRIYDAHSLKEKRAVLQRILTRLRQKFNISVAETGQQDVWQLSGISLVTVSSSRQVAERELERAIKFLDSFPEWERIDTKYEWF